MAGSEPALLQQEGPLMVRVAGLLLAGAFLALVGLVPAADNPPRGDKDKPEALPVAGNWKVYLQFTQRSTKPFFMVRLNNKDGNWTGTAVKDAALGQIPDPAIEKIAVGDGKLTFTLKLKTETLPFEILLPKDAGDKPYGTVLMSQSPEPVMLEKTTLKSLDTFEVNKEIITKSSNPAEV